MPGESAVEGTPAGIAEGSLSAVEAAGRLAAGENLPVEEGMPASAVLAASVAAVLAASALGRKLAVVEAGRLAEAGPHPA
jgi:hypothetical protein